METSARLWVSPARLLKILLVIAFALALISFLVQLYLYTGPEFRGLNSLVAFTYVDVENSVPTWYNSTLLFLCSAALFFIYTFERKRRNRDVRGWQGLALIFLALAVDEIVQFHELVNNIIQEKFNLSGVFYYAWVIPGTLFVLAFVAVYLRFLLHLPTKTRSLALASGALYLAGALGVEIMTAPHEYNYGFENLTYVSLSTVEEFFEIAGASLFLYTLVSHISQLGQAVSLSFGEEHGQAGTAKETQNLELDS